MDERMNHAAIIVNFIWLAVFVYLGTLTGHWLMWAFCGYFVYQGAKATLGQRGRVV